MPTISELEGAVIVYGGVYFQGKGESKSDVYITSAVFSEKVGDKIISVEVETDNCHCDWCN